VQHSRRQQQYRGHRTDGVYSPRPAAGGRDCQGVRRRDRAAGRGSGVMDRELLLELGCEELPASWLPGLTNQIGKVVEEQLRARRLPPEAAIESYSTPRRLTVRISRVPERQTDLEELLTGPPVSAAFKPDGTPTPAAAGFAVKQGVDVTTLERVRSAKGEYVAYRRRQRGKTTVDVLPDVLGATLRNLTF